MSMAGRIDFGQKASESSTTSSFFIQPAVPARKIQSPTMLRGQRSAFFDPGDMSPITAPVPSAAQKKSEPQSRSSTSTADPFEVNDVEDGVSEGQALRQGVMVYPLPPLPETQTLPESNPEAEMETVNPNKQMNVLLKGEPVLEDMTAAGAMHHIRTHDVGEAFDRFSNTFNGLLAEKHLILTKHVDVMFNCNKIFHTHRTLLEHRRDGLHKRKVEALGSAENFRKKCLVALPECLNGDVMEENEVHGD